MSEANKLEASYMLGHSEAEIIRLEMQAQILRPITERLLRSAGIRPGMRALDLGSGAGDVAMLAAELVGPSGWVVGIDRNSRVLSIAMERANRAGFKHLSFHEPRRDRDDQRLFRSPPAIVHRKARILHRYPPAAAGAPGHPLWINQLGIGDASGARRV